MSGEAPNCLNRKLLLLVGCHMGASIDSLRVIVTKSRVVATSITKSCHDAHFLQFCLRIKQLYHSGMAATLASTNQRGPSYQRWVVVPPTRTV